MLFAPSFEVMSELSQTRLRIHVVIMCPASEKKNLCSQRSPSGCNIATCAQVGTHRHLVTLRIVASHTSHNGENSKHLLSKHTHEQERDFNIDKRTTHKISFQGTIKIIEPDSKETLQEKDGFPGWTGMSFTIIVCLSKS